MNTTKSDYRWKYFFRKVFVDQSIVVMKIFILKRCYYSYVVAAYLRKLCRRRRKMFLGRCWRLDSRRPALLGWNFSASPEGRRQGSLWQMPELPNNLCRKIYWYKRVLHSNVNLLVIKVRWHLCYYIHVLMVFVYWEKNAICDLHAQITWWAPLVLWNA